MFSLQLQCGLSRDFPTKILFDFLVPHPSQMPTPLLHYLLSYFSALIIYLFVYLFIVYLNVCSCDAANSPKQNILVFFAHEEDHSPFGSTLQVTPFNLMSVCLCMPILSSEVHVYCHISDFKTVFAGSCLLNLIFLAISQTIVWYNSWNRLWGALKIF